MKEIKSKQEPNKLLHLVIRKEDFSSARVDISSPNEPLQLSILRLNSGKTFKPHKHIYCEKITNMTQESWVVVQGSVKVFYYDLDDSIVHEDTLMPGDASVTFYGGHNYLILEDDTMVYEFKTGPYQGQEKDKAFL